MRYIKYTLRKLAADDISVVNKGIDNLTRVVPDNKLLNDAFAFLSLLGLDSQQTPQPVLHDVMPVRDDKKGPMTDTGDTLTLPDVLLNNIPDRGLEGPPGYSVKNNMPTPQLAHRGWKVTPAVLGGNKAYAIKDAKGNILLEPLINDRQNNRIIYSYNGKRLTFDQLPLHVKGAINYYNELKKYNLNNADRPTYTLELADKVSASLAAAAAQEAIKVPPASNTILTQDKKAPEQGVTPDPAKPQPDPAKPQPDPAKTGGAEQPGNFNFVNWLTLNQWVLPAFLALIGAIPGRSGGNKLLGAGLGIGAGILGNNLLLVSNKGWDTVLGRKAMFSPVKWMYDRFGAQQLTLALRAALSQYMKDNNITIDQDDYISNIRDKQGKLWYNYIKQQMAEYIKDNKK